MQLKLKGWKYEGRKIADKLQQQMLSIVEILNDSSRVGNKNWTELQKYIAGELGITPGQIRTIKRMMEELDIIKKGVLNTSSISNTSEIYTDNGRTFVELMAIEKLMNQRGNTEDQETVREIRTIYCLHYQKVLAAYTYKQNGRTLHPLRATLKAVKKFGYLDFWEWYLLNTIIQTDEDEEEEVRLEKIISDYRAGEINSQVMDITENRLSHVYVLGNYEYAGLVCVKGNNQRLKVTLNHDYDEIIDEILRKVPV